MKYFLLISAALTVVLLTTLWYWLAHNSTFRGSYNQIKSPLIIFDFDGTICPSFPLFIEQVNFLADGYKLKKIKPEEVEDFKNMSHKKIMERLGVSLFKLPFLLRRARHNVQQQLLELKPVPGIVEILKELKRRQYSLGILTSNSSENVLLYLQEYQIAFFDFVYAGNNAFGKEKHLKTILKKAHLDPEKDLVIYIGDEVRDMEASRRAQIKSIGVTWGYNSLELLQESHPDFLSETLSQLLFSIDSAANYSSQLKDP